MLYNITVNDMHCEKCVSRIEMALTALDIKFTVNLSTKTVVIDGCEHCLKTAIAELEDLGFTPEI